MKTVDIKTGQAQKDAERYYTLQEAIVAAYNINGHIHKGPVDQATQLPTFYDVCDSEDCS
jgi:riboflavin synthase alpha subunit